MAVAKLISPISKQSIRKLRVAAYCRVSTSSADQLNSYATQVRYYTKLIQSKEEWELVEVFADEGISGMRADNRTEFQRMIRMCELKQIDLIITKSVSRFARNVPVSLQYIRQLKGLGIGIQFEKEGINTLALGDEMLLNTFAAISQEESQANSQHVRTSITKLMANGEFVPGNAPYGYRLIDGRLEIYEPEAKIIQWIFTKYLEGYSITEIANELTYKKLPTKNGNDVWNATNIISKGATVTIEQGSKIASFTSPSGGETRIRYKTAQKARFAEHAIVNQEGEPQIAIDSGLPGQGKVVQLDGKNTSPFFTYIKNATLLSNFYFSVDQDVMLKIHENCKMKIEGKFHSEGSIRLFNIENMSGDISEVELLSDTFKNGFTKTKIPGEFGYNTFSIGFKKKAINVIANVMDARNYLYLWIYAHHKVIYYANFLIPVLAKELFPGKDKKDFPSKCLNFENIKVLDDAYIWTAIQYIRDSDILKTNSKNKELKTLLEELFTRKYKRSLYKSLAEYDLYFEKYDKDTKIKLQEYINSHLLHASQAGKPYIESHEKGKFSVGYFKPNQIERINEKLEDLIKNEFSNNGETPDELKKLKLSDLVYVAVDYKRKQLETLKAFIDMEDDIVPISQIPLLESQTTKSTPNGVNTYFYLYYKTSFSKIDPENESKFIKAAVKEYFDSIVETKIKK